jgi:hypothetical protein
VTGCQRIAAVPYEEVHAAQLQVRLDSRPSWMVESYHRSYLLVLRRGGVCGMCLQRSLPFRCASCGGDALLRTACHHRWPLSGGRGKEARLDADCIAATSEGSEAWMGRVSKPHGLQGGSHSGAVGGRKIVGGALE